MQKPHMCSRTSTKSTSSNTTLFKTAQTGESCPDEKTETVFPEVLHALRIVGLEQYCPPHIQSQGFLRNLSSHETRDSHYKSGWRVCNRRWQFVILKRKASTSMQSQTDAKRRPGLVLLDLPTPFNWFQTRTVLAGPCSQTFSSHRMY